MMDSSARTGTKRHPLQQLDEICMETCEWALLFFECAFGRAVVVVMAVGGGSGGGRVGRGGFLAALLPPVSPLSRPGRQAVLGSPAPR